ncbi:MAG: acetylserotonin O-methyltransferase [Actinomycetota bacterium]|nr:acetylserotonin O-methyltransferase [Actinomycetota bacterium]
MSAAEVPPRDTLLRMTNAFQASQAIHVAATLGIADLLEDGPRHVDELAQTTGTHAPTLYRLLRALASVGVFAEQPDGQFGSTPLAEYLRTNTPRSLRAWAMQIGQQYLWTSWGHLLHSVRTGEPAFPELHGTTAWEYRAAHPEEDAVFNAAMTALSAGVAEAIVQSYDFSGMDVLMDVGGGEGVLLAAILAENPALRGVLFDQPHVLTGANDLLEREGVVDRCELVSGSFFEAVPGGADAHLLKSIVHDWDDAATVKILRACRAAIANTGRLLVVEPIIQPGNEPDPAKFSDLNMLVMLGGRERTADDFERLYAEAGFRLSDIIRTRSLMAIIEGVPV